MLHHLRFNIKITEIKKLKNVVLKSIPKNWNCFSKIATIAIICLTLIHNLCSQSVNLGIPPVTNYNKATYLSGHQNWATLCIDGKLYSGNNGGLLVYDGVKWNTISSQNNTIVRSIATNGHDKIYIGAQGELGYYEPNDQGILTYHSILNELSSSYTGIEDVWNVELIGDTLYAHVKPNEILTVNNGITNTIKTNSTIWDMTKIGNEIYLHVNKNGIYKIAEGKLIMQSGTEIIADYEVVDMIGHKSGILFITAYNGIFYYKNSELKKWKTNADAHLKLNQARCGLSLENGDIIIGTHHSGIAIIDHKGNTTSIINKSHGLQSNTINDMSIAEDGSLWLATMSGLDKIDIRSRYKAFYPDGIAQGGVYDIEIWNNRIYFCTTNGVYSIENKNYYNPLEGYNFKLIEGSKGQAYSLDLINGELFCGHHKGAFRIDKYNKLIPILKDLGTWKFVQLDQKTMAIGTYNGVTIIEKTINNGWIIKHKVQDLEESCRVMVLDKYNNLWVSHPYKDLHKINFNENFSDSEIKKYDKLDGYNANKGNYVFSYHGDCILTNGTGIYIYDNDNDRFIISEELTELYPAGLHVRKILDTDADTWIISDKGTDQLITDEDDNSLLGANTIIRGRTNEHYIGGFENLFLLDSNNIFTCSENGVKLISTITPPQKNSQPMITSVSLPGQRDSVLYGGFGGYSEFNLHKNISNIKFEYTSPNPLKPIQYYRYKLEGLDDNWSDWTSNQSKEYGNLEHGTYTFFVRSVNADSSESKETQVHFSIAIPWYKTTIAYLIYSLLFLLALLSILLIPRQKYKQDTAKLSAEKEQTEADLINVKKQTERDLNKIRSEKLESEIAFKNKELAMSTMYLLQKNETLNAIRSEVEVVEKSIVDAKAKKELRKVVNLLRSDTQLENEWQNFSIHFDQVHHNFLKRLKSEYPKLTPNDQKLSAYLRMNLTTKEISPLLKISIRGVEIARYRLRKKLQLAKEENLNDFMMRF